MWQRSSLLRELVQEALDARQEDAQRSPRVGCLLCRAVPCSSLLCPAFLLKHWSCIA